MSAHRWRTAWRRAAPYLVPALVLGVAIALIFWRAWTPLEGERRAFAWDAIWEYWGDLQFQVDAVRAGELPLWNPHDRLGYPFFTDPQTGWLYPPQWPLIGAGLALGDTPYWLISVKVFLHFELAACGTYAVARFLGLPRAAGYLAALIAITSYPMLHNGFSALNWSFAWVPWWLLAGLAWARQPSWPRTGALAVTTALCALSGGWAGFWYGLLVVAPMTIIEVVLAVRAVDPAARRAWLRRLGLTLAAAVALFVLLAGAQIVATAGIVGFTVRAERGVAFFGTTVFAAVDVVGFFIPRFQGENVYLGWGPILLVGLVVALRPDARTLGLAAVFALAILCAMGDRGPFLPSMASVIKPFELFRRAHRYLYVAILPVGLLAGYGLALVLGQRGDGRDLDEDGRARARRAVIAASALMLLIAGVGFVTKLEHPMKNDPVRDAYGWAIGATLVGGFLVWQLLGGADGVRRSAGAVRALVTIAVVVMGIDLWVARVGKVEGTFHAVPRPRLDGLVARAPGPDQLPPRIYDRGKIGYRPGIRLGVRDLGGYEGDPLALQRFQRVLDSVQRAPGTAAAAGIHAIFELEAQGKSGADAQALTQVSSGHWAVKAPAADVAWFDTARVVESADAAWKAAAAAPGVVAAIEAGAVTQAERARLERADHTSPVVPGRVDTWRRNQVVVTVDAPGDGLVVVRELFHPGWTATVDGRPAHVVPVDGWARGVLVGPGPHRIVFRFDAPLYRWWSLLALLGWLGLAGAGGWWWWRQRAARLTPVADRSA
ncbi:MAG: hypothetical protein KBG28_26315 [Kofleriaceae bacterium]|nr:hypothetical protein [Kofleriaceae bacterium]MBP6837101.1 hypothetical protein [Kofleriaceae bacterium]MBP9207509.1 hypothetical protein [Kofleriaceae bacterium]